MEKVNLTRGGTTRGGKHRGGVSGRGSQQNTRYHASILKNNDFLVSQQNTQPTLNISASQNNITKTLCATTASRNNIINTLRTSLASGTSAS
ncbi:438_t:CDS:2 [Funneliformis mosseae]|uniref:438_t:CDS:1 n=1 Tax=Funneliformis mosseae TaxID=27381 RepID=A0A9N9BHX9_FUNMO|nr:438_t:CDS:2 [Funneliformis mosseae]